MFIIQAEKKGAFPLQDIYVIPGMGIVFADTTTKEAALISAEMMDSAYEILKDAKISNIKQESDKLLIPADPNKPNTLQRAFGMAMRKWQDKSSAWAINFMINQDILKQFGHTPLPQTQPFVLVMDGGIAAFMSLGDFSKPHYGVTDYEGGGHNFWIPFMNAGGRSGTGQIIVMYLPKLIYKIALSALKQGGTKKSKAGQRMWQELIDAYHWHPLPEFARRSMWITERSEELLKEGNDMETAQAQTYGELSRMIKSNDARVTDKNLDINTYTQEGKEYDGDTMIERLRKLEESQ